MCLMQYLINHFSKTFIFLVLILLNDCIICSKYKSLKSVVHSSQDQNSVNSTLSGNESVDEDLIILSSWESIKIWSSNSSLHSSKDLLIDNLLDSYKLNKRKITAIDYYYNEDLCENVLIWCDVSHQSIYSAIVDFSNDEKPYLIKFTKLWETNFGKHVRLAVDSVYKKVYIAFYEFERIDFFDINANISQNILTNISRPVDIAIDSNLQVLFWIENWSCISHISISLTISNTSITRMCSSKPRALAVDIKQTLLYWTDSDGNIFRKHYFNQTNEMIFSNNKLRQSYALDISNNAIYMSDQYKITSVTRSALNTKVVLIESPGILDFKVIKRNHSYCQQISRSNISIVDENTGINDGLSSENITLSHNDNNPNIKYLIPLICGIVLICLTLICLVIIAVKRYCRKTQKVKRTRVKRMASEVTNKVTNSSDKSKLIHDRNVTKTVCIEDLGAFSNNSFADQQLFCSNCPIRQTCSSCEDREECIEKGICLSTYKLLT